MSITGHYIGSSTDKPNDWELKDEQLAFTPIEGWHNAQNQAKVLAQTIDQYGLRGKVWALSYCSDMFLLTFIRLVGLQQMVQLLMVLASKSLKKLLT